MTLPEATECEMGNPKPKASLSIHFANEGPRVFEHAYQIDSASLLVFLGTGKNHIHQKGSFHSPYQDGTHRLTFKGTSIIFHPSVRFHASGGDS